MDGQRNPALTQVAVSALESDPHDNHVSLATRRFRFMDNEPMHMLYDSETYSVTHMLANAVPTESPSGASRDSATQSLVVPTLARHGFEIVDKRAGKEVYLDGSWAELFQQHIVAWQLNTPTQEEVEDTLEQYAELAQNPVVVH